MLEFREVAQSNRVGSWFGRLDDAASVFGYILWWC